MYSFTPHENLHLYHLLYVYTEQFNYVHPSPPLPAPDITERVPVAAILNPTGPLPSANRPINAIAMLNNSTSS